MGSDAYTRALGTPLGVARMLYLVMKSEYPAAGITEEVCQRLVAEKLGQIAAVLAAQRETDPGKVRGLMRSVGLPPDYLDVKPPG